MWYKQYGFNKILCGKVMNKTIESKPCQYNLENTIKEVSFYIADKRLAPNQLLNPAQVNLKSIL